MSRQLAASPAAVLLWIAYTAFLLPFAVSPAPGWLPDAHVYLLMADALSPWHAATPAAHFALETSPFPPLFPLLIGVLGGGADATIARALAAACLCGALAACHTWVRARGFGAGAALLAVTAFALLPGTLLQALEGMSEPLYLMLSLLALVAAARASAALPAAEPRWLVAAALASGLALATRSAGVALVAAFPVWWMMRRRQARRLRIRTGGARQLGALLALALGPVTVWWCVKALLGFPGSYAGALQSRLASYAAEPGAALARAIPEQQGALLRAWHELFALHPGMLARAAASAIGALALLGLARGLARRDLAALYAALYLVLIALWPFPDHAGRFLWPLTPVALVFAAEATAALLRRPAARNAVPAAALALALPSLFTIAARFQAAQGFEAEAFTHTPRWYLAEAEGARSDALARASLARAMGAVAERVPADGCIYAVSPTELMSWSRRIAKTPPPRAIGDAEFDAATRECDWFFLAPLVLFPYETPYYPRERLGKGWELLPLPGSPASGVLARRHPER